MGHGPTTGKTHQQVFTAGIVGHSDESLAGSVVCQTPIIYGADLGRWSNSVFVARAFIVEHLLMSTQKKAGQRPAF